jgi:hypothetical protein
VVRRNATLPLNALGDIVALMSGAAVCAILVS